uniref:ParE toxin of type II toxin-antitoxin system, parDE n=1 Tax=Candidatus Kentrum sp. LPFa TaxID=2126335 RepID=A0A450WSC0_9GAMM|nr:MAG: hypothetical protein BECKLPF1236B_GA0070989_11923 [Candidatus Kentron sp. LPFa]
MKLLVLSCAESEFAEAVDYYNAQYPGLGYEFAAEVQRTFERIRHHPHAPGPSFQRALGGVLLIASRLAFYIKLPIR